MDGFWKTWTHILVGIVFLSAVAASYYIAFDAGRVAQSRAEQRQSNSYYLEGYEAGKESGYKSGYWDGAHGKPAKDGCCIFYGPGSRWTK